MINPTSMTNPVLLTIFYRVSLDDCHTEISIKGSNGADSTLTVIYDSLAGLQIIDIAGDKETETLKVQQHEVITVFLRRESVIAGVGIFQVDVGLIGSHGLVLAPMSIVNMDVRQEDLAVVSRSIPYDINTTYAELAEGVQLL